MRKEQRNQHRVNQGYERELQQINQKCIKMNTSTQLGARASEDTNNQILALKAKHEQEKVHFETKIKVLQMKLKERDESEMDKTKSKGMAGAVTDTQTQAADFANPTAILKLRLQKKTNYNKEKKNLMDMYVRNVDIINDAFNQIKQQTGISSTEEIVTTFIKAEEQNYSLYNYVNMLNSEIDMIEEQNANIEAEIQRHEQIGEMTEKEKEIVRQKLKQEIEERATQMAEKENQIKNIENQLGTIKNNVQSMVENFRKSHFFLSVAQNMQYDEDTTFNENNVTQHLAELEEYISLFITYMAYKQDNQDAPISSLGLENIPAKEFGDKQLNIDAPNSQDIDMTMMMNDDMETEDEMTTDPKALFRKFEEKYGPQFDASKK